MAANQLVQAHIDGTITPKTTTIAAMKEPRAGNPALSPAQQKLPGYTAQTKLTFQDLTPTRDPYSLCAVAGNVKLTCRAAVCAVNVKRMVGLF